MLMLQLHACVPPPKNSRGRHQVHERNIYISSGEKAQAPLYEQCNILAGSTCIHILAVAAHA
jgi:hypothetical protein